MGDGFAQDLRLAWRLWLRSPAFTLSLIITLALPLGAVTALTAIADQLFLSTANLPRPEELVRVYTDFGRLSDGEHHFTVSYPNYRDIAALKSVFRDAAAERPLPLNWFVSDRAEKRWAYVVSPNYFDLLELKPRIGRFFTELEPADGVVLSHRRWQSEFGANPNIVGTSVMLNAQPARILGVAPRGFSGMTFGLEPDVFVPIDLEPRIAPRQAARNKRAGAAFFVIARRRPDLAMPAIQSALDVLASRLRAEHPTANRVVDFSALTERQGRIHPMAKSGFLSFAQTMGWVVAGVLALACANAACLLLARGVARHREILTRHALGASRSRITRQLLTESLAVASVAAAAGLVWAKILLSWLQTVAWPADWPIRIAFEPQLATYAWSLLAALITVVAFGLLPALRTAGAGLPRPERRGALALGLVSVQVAISFSLLVGSGLFVQSLERTDEIDLGFDPDNLVMASIDLGVRGYSDSEARTWLSELAQEFERSEIVERVGLATTLPFDLNIVRTEVRNMEQRTVTGSESIFSDVSTVDAGYFPTMRVPLIRGRNFTPSDDEQSEPVAIVNQALARRLWDDDSGVGEHVQAAKRDLQVVGVVRDGKYLSLGDDDKPWLYLPLTQSSVRALSVVARARADPLEAGAELRRIATTKNPLVAIHRVRTMEHQLGLPLLPSRVGALVLSLFGLVALVLSTVALYGTISFQVARRHKEIGIRRALGASGLDVVSLVSTNATLAVCLGTAAGVSGCGVILSAVEAFLVPNTERNLLGSVSLSGAILASVAVMAMLMAARRALAINPAAAIRMET